MTQKDLGTRVEKLESAVAGLVQLPRQMEDLSLQFLQLRQEVKAEISGVRGEMVGMRDELRGEMAGMREELRAEMAGMHRELAGAILGLGTQMRTLHEDLDRSHRADW